MNINKSKREMKAKDDGSIICVSHHVNGKCYKTVNTYPYRGIEISKKEFDRLINTEGLKEYLATTGIIELYAK